jgi:hypothetical protein
MKYQMPLPAQHSAPITGDVLEACIRHSRRCSAGQKHQAAEQPKNVRFEHCGSPGRSIWLPLLWSMAQPDTLENLCHG